MATDGPQAGLRSWAPGMYDFLLARIAEEKEAADNYATFVRQSTRPPARGLFRWMRRDPRKGLRLPMPDHLQAECGANRRIVKACQQAWEQRRPSGTPTMWGEHVWGGLEHACRELAKIYIDHPDYREEWLQ